MGTPLMGRYAKVTIGSSLVANLGRWNIDIKMDSIDVSAFGTVWGKFLPGMQNWSGTFEGHYDPSDTEGQAAMEALALSAGAIANIQFWVDATHFWRPDVGEDSGAAIYITGWTIQHDKAGVATLTVNFVGYGPLIYV